MDETELGNMLLAHARNAIAERFGRHGGATHRHAALDQPGASFVTLTRQGDLRGCIGSLEAHRPLGLDVRENALAAAFRDPRFAPLAVEEFEHTRVEVSLLTPAMAISFRDEADFLAQLRPGVDGIVFQYGRHRSTFLPQVWESLPEPQQFMQQLKRKAGLPPNFWHEAVSIARYEVTKWKEVR
ncbi:MAG: AmmeMemoRadiSam system protein A [Rhodocyclaceae bacterium]|jgi:AmmeMemoRadiSam system protein A|nr:AmmeMemoRadiSam system protein A [Rhodocyclaceae bacterium]MCC7270541.1 AmmeMemoRadiSam system protein A [Rhodocyclaceae bacterium]OQY72929.1 MAG: AMMECR1 domain-containing protein [Rhodocyclaceae bacterium UTPRO2]